MVEFFLNPKSMVITGIIIGLFIATINYTAPLRSLGSTIAVILILHVFLFLIIKGVG